MLYSPCYPVNITSQGAAAKLLFLCCLSRFGSIFFLWFVFFFYFLMTTSQNYTKTIIRLRLSDIRQHLLSLRRIITDDK